MFGLVGWLVCFGWLVGFGLCLVGFGWVGFVWLVAFLSCGLVLLCFIWDLLQHHALEGLGRTHSPELESQAAERGADNSNRSKKNKENHGGSRLSGFGDHFLDIWSELLQKNDFGHLVFGAIFQGFRSFFNLQERRRK